MHLAQFYSLYLPEIEDELQAAVSLAGESGLQVFQSALAYHMGWEGEGAGPQAAGKRVRPMLVLLSSVACGGTWLAALPAAAAVELVHNFSLIHDDIEDNSPLRRGRQTLWSLHGVPQAINYGDALFTLAHLALLRLQAHCPAEIVLQAAELLQATCLHLTQGQYLDMSYESRTDLRQADYWPMVAGKTAALLSACTRLGALAAGAPVENQAHYADFGRLLGLAFQVQDDILGIWGDTAQTGKSADSDLVSGKKSLPVLIGLERNAAFADRWRLGTIRPEEVPALAALLEREGARQHCQSIADNLTRQALDALHAASPQGEAGLALFELAQWLLQRSG